MPGPVRLMEQLILGNTVRAWIAACVVLVATMVLLWLLRVLAARRLSRLAQRTQTQWDDLAVELLGGTRFFLMLAISVYGASFALHLSETHVRIIRSIAIIALLLQGALWGNRLISFWLTQHIRRRGSQDRATLTTVSTLGFVGRALLWTTLLLLALDNLGIRITGLITGLGIGGVAMALAAQEVLKDLFASLAIALDKPFLIGDYITIDGIGGTVEQIGIKTIRLRSQTGEEVILSNSNVLGSRIRNFQRMQERWIALSVGVTFQTPPEKLAVIPAIFREVVEAQEGARFDRAHFKTLGESAFLFEAAFFVTAPDYRAFLDIQQAVNLGILRRFADEGIELALPAQRVQVAGRVETGVPPTSFPSSPQGAV